jgi:thiol:disulfide interchange protein DsbD
MKRICFTVFILLALPAMLYAQILNPVHWNYSAKKIGSGQYILHMTAQIDAGWHIYAQDAGEGPIPTSFSFDDTPQAEFVGKVKAVGKLQKAYDKSFNSVLKFYEGQVDFVQYVKAKPGAQAVKGTLEYMVCDNHQCLPPKQIDFQIKL